MIGLISEFKTANEKAMKNRSLFSLRCKFNVFSTARGPENK